jgi:putative flippase GtrA
MRSLFFEVFRYGLASAVALGVDMSVLWELANRAGMHYQLAAALGFMAGTGVAYSLSVRFVFRFRQLSNPAVELVSFLALGLAGLLVNAAALAVAVGTMGLGLVTAKVFAAACTFTTNFTLRRQLLFAPPKVR